MKILIGFLVCLCMSTSFRAQAQSYTLPGESSPPAAEEFIGAPGLVGIYFGHLPCDGRPRQKVTLVLVSDPRSGAPKGYTLERLVVGGPNVRYVTKGSWKQIKDPKRPGAVIYELDSEAPQEFRDFWAIDRSNLLVLEQDLKVRRSGFGDPYTVAYVLYARHCTSGQKLKDCSDE